MKKKRHFKPYIIDDSFSVPEEIMTMSSQERQAEIDKIENELKERRYQEMMLEDIFTKEEIEQRKNLIWERAIRDYYSDIKTSRDEGIKEEIDKEIEIKEKKLTLKLKKSGLKTKEIAEFLDISEDEVKKYL